MSNYCWINNPFYLYTICISIATLTMSTWLREVHIWQTIKVYLVEKSMPRAQFVTKESLNIQLFQSNKILNGYKLNILNVATFMCKVNQKTVPSIFFSRFQKLFHFYPTRFSELNCIQSIHNIKSSKYSISIRGPCTWNSFFSREEKKTLLCINLRL